MSAYSNCTINGTVHTWLQYYGWHPCVMGSELTIGDRIAFNTGVSYEIVGIVKETKTTITFSVIDEDGKLWETKKSKNAYVPAKKIKKQNATEHKVTVFKKADFGY